jgi:hypothetical protein
MERWVNDPCRCLEPDCSPGACPCGGSGARRFVASRRASRARSCLRCGRSGLTGSLCGDCAAIVAVQRARLPREHAYPCAFCRAWHGGAIDLGGVFLCAGCSSSDIWEGSLPDADSAVPPCSFCGEVPRRAGIIAGPTIYLCSPCVARAHALRGADRRDPPRAAPPSCSFDGKTFPELRELFVVGELAFCVECVGLLDDLLPALDRRARLGLAHGAKTDRCVSCGGGEAVRRPEHGPWLCAACVRAGKRVGRWCLTCRGGIDAAERAAQVREGFLCARCTDWELHVARLTSFAERR